MRVLCVGRHEFLSEHLCRFFRELGADCVGVVGAADVVSTAARFEPQVIVGDCDLLTSALLEAWTVEPCLRNVPVLAVSLTRRPEESLPEVASGIMAVVYLPTLDREQALSLLEGVGRPRGVTAPLDFRVALPPHAAIAR